MTVEKPPLQLPANSRAWVFSDGKAGHEAQCLGVVEALGIDAEIKRVPKTGLARLLAPWGPVAAAHRPGRPGSPFFPPFPDFAFATGRTTIPYIRALKQIAGPSTYTIILMDPRTGPDSADLIWVPEHDQRRGANVITTLGVPHRFSKARLEKLRGDMPAFIAALPSPRIACLIGGPNGIYRYGREDEQRLIGTLRDLAQHNFGLMITVSRRTPERLTAELRALRCASVFLWEGHGENPYPEMLAHAEMFLITADSVSMACEAAATGKPIYVFAPSGGSAKFDRFHAALAKYGATRSLPSTGMPLESWNYEPLSSTDDIAAEIVVRWRHRAAADRV